VEFEVLDRGEQEEGTGLGIRWDLVQCRECEAVVEQGAGGAV
jgi:hypothetical protein